MEHALARTMMTGALGVWYSKRNTKSIEAILKTKYYNKLYNCGNPRLNKTGKVFYPKCSSAICPTCSLAWSKLQANALIRCFPDSKNEDFVFMTVGIGLTHDIDEVFPMFNKFRTCVKNDAYNLRDRKGEEYRCWDQFGVAGTLQIDHFRASEFHLLGTEKQKQYIEKYNYVEDNNKPDDVWVVTGHFVVHRGNIASDDINTLIDNHSKWIYPKDLWFWRDRDMNIRKILEYSSRVQFGDTMAKDIPKYWNNDTIRVYAYAMLNASGRNKFKFSMMRKGYRTRRAKVIREKTGRKI